MKINATLENLREATGYISEYAEDIGFDQKFISELELAAEEIIINIIDYAYTDNKGEIEVDCNYDEATSEMIVTISDNGIQFNAATAKDPDMSKKTIAKRVGGLGIFLAKKLTNKMVYEREQGKNIVKLFKKRFD